MKNIKVHKGIYEDLEVIKRENDCDNMNDTIRGLIRSYQKEEQAKALRSEIIEQHQKRISEQQEQIYNLEAIKQFDNKLIQGLDRLADSYRSLISELLNKPSNT